MTLSASAAQKILYKRKCKQSTMRETKELRRMRLDKRLARQEMRQSDFRTTTPKSAMFGGGPHPSSKFR